MSGGGLVALTDILYVAWQRLAYTQASFEALIANTDWSQVGTLFVHDDDSTDGTKRWLRDRIESLDGPTVAVFESAKRGSPVAVMNWYLDQPSEAGEFVKIDSDFVVCPGWLGEVLRVAHLYPGYDALGIAPWEGPPALTVANGNRGVLDASHIGGVGLIRRRVFAKCRPVARGRYGWTEFQHDHPLQVGWLVPDMPCFELDRLPVEPWQDLARRYHIKGWSREWPKYENPDYYEWWTDSQPKEE